MSKIIDGIRKDLMEIPKTLLDKLRSLSLKKLFLTNLPYIMLAWFGNKTAWLYEHVDGEETLTKLMNTVADISRAFDLPAFSIKPMHGEHPAECTGNLQEHDPDHD